MQKGTEQTLARAMAVLGEQQVARVLREAINGAEGGGSRTARSPSSAKAKGRALVVAVKAWLLVSFPDLEDDDVLIQTTSVGGQDIHLSPKAAQRFPFALEMKNTETLQMWAALSQAKVNALKKNRHPAVIFKRNNSDTFICFPLSVFTEVYINGSAQQRNP